MRKAKITFEVDNCFECPYQEKHSICVPSGTVYTGVPDRCPFVLQQYAVFLWELDENEDWWSCMRANTNNPWNLPNLDFDLGASHVFKTIEYAKSFIHDLTENSFKDFLYGEECHSVERDLYFMQIVAMLRDVGEHEPSKANRAYKYDKLRYIRGASFPDEDKDILIDAILHWDEAAELVEDFDKMKEIAKVHRSKPTLDTSTAVKVSLLLGSMLDVGQHRTPNCISAPEHRLLAKAFRCVEKVELNFTYNDHYGKVSGPSPKNGAELHYTATEDFNVNALKAWPELILTPRLIIKDLLGLKSFKFFVNNKEINIGRFAKNG